MLLWFYLHLYCQMLMGSKPVQEKKTWIIQTCLFHFLGYTNYIYSGVLPFLHPVPPLCLCLPVVPPKPRRPCHEKWHQEKNLQREQCVEKPFCHFPTWRYTPYKPRWGQDSPVWPYRPMQTPHQPPAASSVFSPHRKVHPDTWKERRVYISHSAELLWNIQVWSWWRKELLNFTLGCSSGTCCFAYLASSTIWGSGFSTS